MKVKELIEKLNKLPQELEIYTNDPQETGGYITFDQYPEIVTLVEIKADIVYTVIPTKLETYIDKQEYNLNNPKVLRSFEAIEIVL